MAKERWVLISMCTNLALGVGAGKINALLVREVCREGNNIPGWGLLGIVNPKVVEENLSILLGECGD